MLQCKAGCARAISAGDLVSLNSHTHTRILRVPSDATDDALEIARASYAIRAVSQVVVSHGRRGDRIEVGIFDGRSGRPCFTAYGIFVHGRDSCHVDVEEKRER